MHIVYLYEPIRVHLPHGGNSATTATKAETDFAPLVYPVSALEAYVPETAFLNRLG